MMRCPRLHPKYWHIRPIRSGCAWGLLTWGTGYHFSPTRPFSSPTHHSLHHWSEAPPMHLARDQRVRRIDLTEGGGWGGWGGGALPRVSPDHTLESSSPNSPSPPCRDPVTLTHVPHYRDTRSSHLGCTDSAARWNTVCPMSRRTPGPTTTKKWSTAPSSSSSPYSTLVPHPCVTLPSRPCAATWYPTSPRAALSPFPMVAG